MTSKQLTGASAAAVWDWVLNDGIRPHLNEVKRIVQDGRIAVVLFEIHESCVEGARNLGYDGKRPVFPMDAGVRRQFIAALRDVGDTVAADWAEKRAQNRIFMMVEMGTFLVNLGEGDTLTIEPGSLNFKADEEALRKTFGSER